MSSDSGSSTNLQSVNNNNSNNNNNNPNEIQSLTPLPPNSVLISQGAEARIFSLDFMGKSAVVKERFPKKYRHPVLDKKLSLHRMKSEVRSITRVRKIGVETPCIYFINKENNSIVMERVEGLTIKQYLFDNILSISSQNSSDMSDGVEKGEIQYTESCFQACLSLGETIARIHDADLVHGDLTTSNFMLRNAVPTNIVAIDFGLSYVSTLSEDKAVDLYVLERAFLSTHPLSATLFEAVLRSYTSVSKKAKPTIAKLEQVRLRGRKKLAFG